MKEKLLITGGSGYIGSALCNSKLLRNYEITVFDIIPVKNTSLYNQFIRGELNYVQGDLKELKKHNVLFQSTHYLIHLAGISDGVAGMKNPDLTHELNYECFKDLIEIIEHSQLKHLVFISTIGVYGSHSDKILDEESATNPADPYSFSKLNAENEIRKLNSNLNYTILRLGMVNGYSTNTKKDFLINAMTIDAYKQKVINVIGGDQRRPQININDVVGLISNIITSTQEFNTCHIYNVVSDNPSINEIARILEKKIENATINRKKSLVKTNSLTVDSKNLKVLKYKFKFTFQDGIDQILTALKNGQLQ